MPCGLAVSGICPDAWGSDAYFGDLAPTQLGTESLDFLNGTPAQTLDLVSTLEPVLVDSDGLEGGAVTLAQLCHCPANRQADT